MSIIKNIFWLFKVFSYCIKNGYKINPEKNKDFLFIGPQFPLVVKQEEFLHGWRFVAKSKDNLIVFKFPAHYNIYNVDTFLFNNGYKIIS